jgi:hypothetical protein
MAGRETGGPSPRPGLYSNLEEIVGSDHLEQVVQHRMREVSFEKKPVTLRAAAREFAQAVTSSRRLANVKGR